MESSTQERKNKHPATQCPITTSPPPGSIFCAIHGSNETVPLIQQQFESTPESFPCHPSKRGELCRRCVQSTNTSGSKTTSYTTSYLAVCLSIYLFRIYLQVRGQLRVHSDGERTPGV